MKVFAHNGLQVRIEYPDCCGMPKFENGDLAAVASAAERISAFFAPLTLISSLAFHTAALRADPRCSLLLGEPGERGDPLTHPRVTLACRADFLPRDGGDHARIRAHYLQTHPKATLYVDFADFSFVVFAVESAALNGGFGKAFRLTASDLD